jgi:hypothetical protein
MSHEGNTQKRAYRLRLYYNILFKFDSSVLAYLVLSEKEKEELK